MSNDRVKSGAHYKIKDMCRKEHDELFELAFPDIYDDRILYEAYKEWIYLFE